MFTKNKPFPIEMPSLAPALVEKELGPIDQEISEQKANMAIGGFGGLLGAATGFGMLDSNPRLGATVMALSALATYGMVRLQASRIRKLNERLESRYWDLVARSAKDHYMCD